MECSSSIFCAFHRFYFVGLLLCRFFVSLLRHTQLFKPIYNNIRTANERIKTSLQGDNYVKKLINYKL